MAPWLQSFRVRLTLLFGGLSVVIGSGMTVYLEQVATSELTRATSESLDSIARSIAYAFAESLRERDREITLMAQFPVMTAGELDAAELRRRLEAAKRSYKYYAWIGVANKNGLVESAAGGLLEGQDVSQRPWFVQGLRGAFMGDVHEAVLLAKQLPNPSPDEPLRFIDFASPIHGSDGRVRGVLGAHADWSWAEAIVLDVLTPDNVNQGVEVFIVSKAGQILYPYDAMGKVIAGSGSGKNPPGVPDRGGDESFLTSSAPIKSATSTDLGWQVVVRQAQSQALAPVATLHDNFLICGLLATLLFMLLADRLAVAFSQPVVKLADAAQRIAQGDETATFAVDSRTDEITRLTTALQEMTQTLVSRRQALEASNATLEQTVVERTASLLEANRQLERLARRDAMTGLYNRLAANEEVHAEFLRMKRSGTVYSVLLMDVDHFKHVNDSFGHETGDQVLKHVADILAKSARVTDFVARFGGEEFLAILPETFEDGALVVANKICSAVAESQLPVVGQVTISIGAAVVGLTDASEDDAVRRADQALYRAKDEGRNRVVLGQRSGL